MNNRLIFTLLLFSVACHEDELTFPLPNRCGAPGVAIYENNEPSLFNHSVGHLSSGEINATFTAGTRRFWLVSNGILNTEEGTVRLHNCLLMEEGASLQVITSNGGNAPASLLPDPDTRHFFTLNQGQVFGETLELIVSKWLTVGEGRDAKHESSWVFALSLRNWQVTDSKQIEADASHMIGAASLRHGDHTYIYITKNVFWNKEASVARVAGSFFQQWEYFDGNNWQSNPTHLRSVVADVGDFFSVFRQGDEFQLVSFGALLSDDLRLQRAHSPEEGWRPMKTLYCESDGDDGNYAVNSIVIASTDESLSCVYSRIDKNMESLNNATPRFLEVHGWNY